MATSAEIQVKIAQIIIASDKYHDVVNGPASGEGSEISTEAGLIPSFSKMLADLQVEFNEFLDGLDAPSLTDANTFSGAQVIEFPSETGTPFTIQYTDPDYEDYVMRILNSAAIPMFLIDQTGSINCQNISSSGNVTANAWLIAAQLRIANGSAPASSTATGIEGEVRWDANYQYRCVATDSWKRTPLSTW